MQITGNTIFIPGGTSGLGLGLALRFHAAGNKVIVGGRRIQLLDQIRAENSGVETVVIDTADPESIIEASADVQRRFPATNVLIAMAGIMEAEDVTTSAFLEVAERTVTTNLLGPIRLISAFTEFLATQPDSTIVTVSSGLAFVPFPLTPTYNATKAAIHSLSRGIRLQLAGTSIGVVELVPPGVRTTLMGQQDSEHAMPVEEFLSETMALLEAESEAEEILVERVKFMRNAESTIGYRKVLESFGAA